MNLTFGRAALALLALLPTGCSILSGPPERPLYRLHPAIAFTTALPRSDAQLVVATPTAPAGINTARIALSRAPVSLDYFAEAIWSDRVPFLVQSALVEGFEKSAAAPAVSAGGVRADFFVDTDVRDFTAVYDSPTGPPRASVKFDLKLIRASDRQILGQTELGGEANAAANTLPEIVLAFDKALGGAVERAVAWTLNHRGLSERRRALNSRTRFVLTGGAEH